VNALPRVPGREVVKALRKIGYDRDRQRAARANGRSMLLSKASTAL
jgi:hypothetical protein